MPAKSRVLDEGGLSGGEVAHGAVAEPAAVGLDVESLGDRELRARGLHVPTKILGRTRLRDRVAQRPSVIPKRLQVASIVGVNLQCDFKLRAEASRQRDHLPEFMRL